MIRFFLRKMKNQSIFAALVLASPFNFVSSGETNLKLLSDGDATAIVRAQREARETRADEIRQSIIAVPALDQRVVEIGERKVVVRRVAQAESFQEVEVPIMSKSSDVIGSLPPFEGEIINETISMAANVYGDDYSEITWRDLETREEFAVWTNICLNYLSPISTFIDGQTHYDYFGFIYPYDDKAEEERLVKAAELGYEVESRWKEPPVTLSEDYYEYVVVAADPSAVPEKLYRQLDALFGYYLENKTELEIRYKNARTMEAARKKDLEENPPEPKESITNFWPGENSVYLDKSK